MAQTRLQPIDIVEQAPADAAPSRKDDAFTGLLALSLKALSQRALIALSSLVDLLLIAAAFVLWLNVMAEPTVLQLIGVGMYAAFTLLALWMRREKQRK